MGKRSWLLILCLLLAGCTKVEEAPWWEPVIHAQAFEEAGLDGEGVVVAILDSGAEGDHPWFQDIDLPTDSTDPLGHGTFITGILSDLMPKATYLPIPITASGTEISIVQITDGLETAIDAGADVAVLSLGLEEDVPALQESVEALAKTGCLIFAAVGNSGTDALYYPAAYDCVVGVGSCNLAGNPSETSQYNESVYVLAPGVKITGPWLYGTTETCKGTSYAVPFAAAMGIAAKAQNRNLSVEEWLLLLQNCTTDWGEPGYDTRSGWGIIDYQKLCQNLIA